MGLVFDVDTTRARFSDPMPDTDIGFNIESDFIHTMHSFEIQYGVKFDPDPKTGIGGAPTTGESWRLGIIQNLLYERLLFVYEDSAGRKPRQVFETEFRLPSVDVVKGATSFPFYNDSSAATGKTAAMRRVADVIYGEKGYREASSKSSFSDNSPSIFYNWDQPQGAITFVKDGTFLLKRIERVDIFQSWLVAMKTGDFADRSLDGPLGKIRNSFIPKSLRHFLVSTAPIASFLPFSMTFWADIDLAKFTRRSSLDKPGYSWGLYGSEGYFPSKPMNRKFTGLGARPSPKAVAGDGGRSPATTGIPSNEVGGPWFDSVGLTCGCSQRQH